MEARKTGKRTRKDEQEDKVENSFVSFEVSDQLWTQKENGMKKEKRREGEGREVKHHEKKWRQNWSGYTRVVWRMYMRFFINSKNINRPDSRGVKERWGSLSFN